MSNQDVPPPDDAAWSAPETVESGWPRPVGPVRSNTAVPAPDALSDSRQHEVNTRRRVAVVIASLVATLGAVVFGFAFTSGHGSKVASNSAVGAPNAVVDPPSASLSGAVSASVTPSLSVPPAPTQDAASAMASAQAAEKAFAPPTSVPANVPSYSGSAPLEAISLPPFLTVTVPSVSAKDQAAQALADQSTLLLKAWVEAWSTGSTYDARYRTLCVEQCRTALDPTITLWKRANITPAGTARFFQLAGGLAKGDSGSGEVGVCLDDSALKAVRNGVTYANPYPLGQPELLVFGLVYDKAVGHWVASEAYISPGDSYCTSDSGGSTS